MKKFLLQNLLRWWTQWWARRAQPLPIAHPRKSAEASSLESLEGRIAPAVITPGTVVFTDLDGDIVTVKFSKNLYDPNSANANLQIAAVKNAFKFASASDESVFDASGPQQLQLLDFGATLRGANGRSLLSGTSISVTVSKAPNGDGWTRVGAISAVGEVVTAVSVAGDLGQIDVGSFSNPAKLGLLKVRSLGSADGTQSGTANFESLIYGDLGKLVVETDVLGSVVVRGVNSQFTGQIGTIEIGRALVGSADALSSKLGRIKADGDIGSAQVGFLSGPGAQGVFGGAKASSGSIETLKNLGSVTVTGSLTGGAGTGSGLIKALGGVGKVRITGDLVGGAGNQSGFISVGKQLGTAEILRSVQGGTGVDSGGVRAEVIQRAWIGASNSGGVVGGEGEGSGLLKTTGNMGAIQIAGSVVGSAAGAGGISAGGNVQSLLIRGDLRGGAGDVSGFVRVLGDLSKLDIRGDLVGAAGLASGSVATAEDLGAALVGGALKGGTGGNSGSIFSGVDASANGRLGSVKIGKGLMGAGGNQSGSIVAGGDVGLAWIGALGGQPAMQGGAGDYSGAFYGAGKVGKLQVMGEMVGSTGKASAAIHAGLHLETLEVSGAVRGGAGDYSAAVFNKTEAFVDQQVAGSLGKLWIKGALIGGGGASSGAIEAEGKLGSLNVTAIQGGAGAWSGSVRSGSSVDQDGAAGSLRVAQNVTGGSGTGAGEIEVDGNLGSLFIGGNLSQSAARVGQALGTLTVNGSLDAATVSAVGQLVKTASKDLALASIVVKGSVSGSRILAGYDLDGTGVNPDAQIGSVRVSGNWVASDLVAGVAALTGTGFGEASNAAISGDDRPGIVAQIGSVTIGGTVTGTADVATDHFGFVAQRILSFKVGAQSLALRSGVSGEVFSLGTTNDVRVREVVV